MMRPHLPARALLALLLLGPLAALPARAEETPTPAPAPAQSAPAPQEKPAAETPAPAAAQPAPEAAPAPAPPRNRSLEYAKELVGKGRYEDALKELDTATQLPGNTQKVTAEISAVRAQALLLKKKSDPKAARDLVVEVLHVDPEALLFAGAPEKMQELVRSVLSEQVLVLHDRIQVAKPDRPLKVRARLVDPKERVAQVDLHFKPHNVPTYTVEPLKKDRTGTFVAVLRDPLALAPAGIDDGFFADYYLSARDQAGAVLDTNGTEKKPIVIEFSATKLETIEGGTSEQPPALTELREGPPPAPAPVVAPEKPWFLRWYTLTGAGVVVAAVVGGTVYALSRPPDLQPHIGEIHLPVTP